LGAEQIRAYQSHLVGKKCSWSTFNQAVCALRFLYGVTLGRREMIEQIPFPRQVRTLPVVLSVEDVGSHDLGTADREVSHELSPL
jgi:site-specific recombinase XerD